MAVSNLRLLSFLTLGILGCLSVERSGRVQITPQPQPSQTSRFHVLHDWRETYSRDAVPPLPATALSDIMLKTMGILRDGAGWPGVLMGNLFSRPHATALFIVDGVSAASSFDLTAEQSFDVDQAGLTGCPAKDVSAIFDGDNVVQHLNDLFDGKPQTRSVSANHQAAFAAGVGDVSPAQLSSVMESVQTDNRFLSGYGFGSASDRFDLTNPVDASFLAELVMMKQTVEQLKELLAYVHDGAPDVFVFTVSTLRAMEERYGAASTKMKIATQLVQETITKLKSELVALYGGDILVQALVLEWNYPEMSLDSSELAAAYEILAPFLDGGKEQLLTQLPNLDSNIEQALSTNHYLCSDLQQALGTSFKVTCPTVVWEDAEPHSRLRRQEGSNLNVHKRDEHNVTFGLIGGIQEDRSSLFAPIFLITLFLTLSLGLAVYAISWSMWNMDPGRDSIIYRQVSDPTEARMQ